MSWALPRTDVADPVVVMDCPVCFSAGSARRGVCDICGADVPATPSLTTLPPTPDDGELLPA